jgi:hypothetical protein
MKRNRLRLELAGRHWSTATTSSACPRAIPRLYSLLREGFDPQLIRAQCGLAWSLLCLAAMRRRRGLAAALLAAALLATALLASPPTLASAELDAEPAERRVWYGWQTLLVDAASFALPLGAAAASVDGGQAGNAFALGYMLGGPVVHFAHGNVGRGFGSLGLRVGVPLAGAVAGAAVTSRSGCDYCAFGGAIVGGIAVIGGAIALDASLLAYDREPRTVSVALVPGRADQGTPSSLVVSGSF